MPFILGSAVIAKLASLKQSERLRVIGILVMMLGITSACLFYWIEARSAVPTIDELLPDYSRDRARQIGILMGNFGVMMLEWTAALNHPAAQAVMIAAVAGLVALGCFRAAWLLDDDERDRVRANDG
jgi:hypothetical protein